MKILVKKVACKELNTSFFNFSGDEEDDWETF